MRLKIYFALTVILFILAANVRADTYSTFQTKRFYSANRHYFVEVTEKKRATLYRNGRHFRWVWTRILPELPRELLVTDDGSRVALVDFYYGNNHDPNAPVVVIFGDGGKEMARYLLKDVADVWLQLCMKRAFALRKDECRFTESRDRAALQTERLFH